MRLRFQMLFFVSSSFALMVFAYRLSIAEDSEEPSKLPPLIIDTSAPLLLVDTPKDKPKIKADNSACYVCHVNYEEEPFVRMHAIADVGCAECHGKSLAHQDDEDHLTAPDNMFAPNKITKLCQKCHDTHDVPARKVIQCWQAKCPTITDPGKLTCTDCHGEHRLEKREYLWEKETGKFLQKIKHASEEGMK